MHGFANLPLANYWPLGVAIAFLAVAGANNLRTMRVPNHLTLGAIAAAWIAALLASAGIVPTSGGSLATSLMGAVLGLMILLPFYLFEFMPAGCVKAHMAFGAWIGCALGTGPTFQAMWMATLCGAVATAAGVLVQWYARKATLAPDYSDVTGPQPVLLFPMQATLSAGSILGLLAGLALGYIA